MLREDPIVKKAPPRDLVSPGKPRAAARRGNPYSADCPTRMVLDCIADKWTVLVLGLLAENPLRFNELRRQIDGLTQKMLSQTLKALERDGLVLRKATPTVPLTVEYSITPLGRTLAATVEALSLWAQAHIGDVMRARDRFDAASR